MGIVLKVNLKIINLLKVPYIKNKGKRNLLIILDNFFTKMYNMN